MRDSVINHAAGARVPRVADATSPPACTVQRHESTLKSSDTLLTDRTSPYVLHLPPLRLPSRGLTSWVPVTHWYSQEVFRLAKSVNLIRKASVNLTIFLINKGLIRVGQFASSYDITALLQQKQ